MNDLIALIIMRSLERMAAIALGGSMVYMAYKLFLAIPLIADPDNFRFKKYISLHLFKIALGALFLMFGGFIVLSSIFNAPQLKERTEHPAGALPTVTTRQYSGMMHQKNTKTTSDKSRGTILASISHLNSLDEELCSEADVRAAGYIHSRISNMKLTLMESVWEDQSWGSLWAFREWVRAGEDPKQVINSVAKDIFYATANNQ